jgi:hypothetical protein
MNPKKDGSLAGYLPPFEELRLGSTPLPIGLDRTLGVKRHVNEVQSGRDGSDSTAVAGDCQIVMRMRVGLSLPVVVDLDMMVTTGSVEGQS